MKKYRLCIKSAKGQPVGFKLLRFMSADEVMELSSDLYWEGLHQESNWWLARWHEHPDGYWDTEETGMDYVGYCMNPALLNVGHRLTDPQMAIARGKRFGSVDISWAA